MEDNKRREFELYDNLSHDEKIHLQDFLIINSIKNAVDKEFTYEEEEKLFDVIDNAIYADETGANVSVVADSIVKAYENKEISLESLQNMDKYDVLDCAIGSGNFSDYNEAEDEEEL